MSRCGDALRWLVRFWETRRATAAVEFAVVLPVALILYIGAAEVADAVLTSRSLTNVTRSIVDLLSRQPTSSNATSVPAPSNAVTSQTLSNIFIGAQSIMYPKSFAPLTMTLSAVDVTNNAQGKCCSALVRWSYSLGGTLRPCNTQLTGTAGRAGLTQLPSALLPTGTVLAQPLSYIIADTAYNYQPIFGGNLLPVSSAMTRAEYMMPRSPGQVIAAALPGSGAQYGQVCY